MASIILDAGHGGSDPGAVYNGRQEKDDALKLTMAVGKILEQNGVNVSYTRTTDVYETPYQKAMEANASGADYLVSIHRNSGTMPNSYSGVQSLVYSDNGKRAVLARNINERLVNTGFEDLGLSERPNLVVLKRSKMPAVLIETGFINSDKDNKLFDEKFDSIAKAIADGILATLYPAQGDEGYDKVPYNMDYSNTEIGSVEFNTFNFSDNEFNEEANGNDYTGDINGSDYTKESNGNEYQYSFDGGSMDLGETMEESYEKSSFMQADDMQMPNPNGKLYRVQVGAYTNKENADRMLMKLMNDGFPAFMIYEDGYYKVQVGAYAFLPNAIRMESRLRRYKYSTYITT